MRICFFGDSFVLGTGDDDALGWVGRVVAGARRGGHDLTAYNLGIRRDTSADVAGRWKREAELRLPSSCDGRLVFSFGANDCASDERGEPRVAHAASVANAAAILEVAQRWLPTLMVGPAVLAEDHQANARLGALSAEYAKVCERLGVPYLEIRRLLLASSTWRDEACAGDGAHPNRAGYTIVAEAMASWDVWRSWLDDAKART